MPQDPSARRATADSPLFDRRPVAAPLSRAGVEAFFGRVNHTTGGIIKLLHRYVIAARRDNQPVDYFHELVDSMEALMLSTSRPPEKRVAEAVQGDDWKKEYQGLARAFRDGRDHLQELSKIAARHAGHSAYRADLLRMQQLMAKSAEYLGRVVKIIETVILMGSPPGSRKAIPQRGKARAAATD